MNIVWISNITFPEAQALLGVKSNLKSSGGWLLGSAAALVAQPDVVISVISINKGVSRLTRLDGEKILYYIVPFCNRIKDYNKYMRRINNEVQPDVVHIHGTELPYGLSWLTVNTSENVVVSIQGLVSVIGRYYLAGLTHKEIISSITIRDIFRKTILGNQRDFQRRGKREIAVIKSVKHVIGRTDFDKAHSLSINPRLKYHHCEETLRENFYEGQWMYNCCIPHSIFLSQATYPIKGLHIMLKALSLIKLKFPDVQLRVAGGNIVNNNSIIECIRRSGYGEIINKIIKRNCLENNIVFTGPLDAEGMKREYLHANVFVCPSAIENSPNSVGEAQLLGVPIVASFVGGIPDMMKGDEDHLYRFEEVEMLAAKIVEVFDSRDNIKTKTETMRLRAQKRHDPKKNVQQLMSIYNSILRADC